MGTLVTYPYRRIEKEAREEFTESYREGMGRAQVYELVARIAFKNGNCPEVRAYVEGFVRGFFRDSVQVGHYSGWVHDVGKPGDNEKFAGCDGGFVKHMQLGGINARSTHREIKGGLL